MGAVNGVYAETHWQDPGSHLINNGSVLALQGPPFGDLRRQQGGLRSLSDP